MKTRLSRNGEYERDLCATQIRNKNTIVQQNEIETERRGTKKIFKQLRKEKKTK